MIDHLTGWITSFPTYRENRRLYWFGIALALFFFVYTLLAITYAPTDTKLLMRHAGVFFAHLGVVGFFLMALLTLYILFFWKSPALLKKSGSLTIVFLFFTIFIVILFLSPPFFSSDIYGYISRAVIANVHHANPYQYSPADLGYSGVVAWPESVSVYGPLFINYSLLVTKIVGSNVVANLLVFRILAVLALVGCVWLVYAILGRTAPQYQHVGTALFAWNPFVLLEAVHSAHNDVFMMLCILWALYMILSHRYVWATTALTAAFLIKFSTASLVPVVGLLILQLPWARMWRTGLAALGVAATLVVAAYLPLHHFGSNIENLGSSFFTYNNLTFPQSILVVILSIVDKAIPSFDYNLITQRAAYIISFLVLYLYALFSQKKQEDDTASKQFFWILLLFLSFLGLKFNVWYALWFTPLVLLIKDVRYHVLIIFITLYGFLYYATLNVFFPNVIFWVILIGYWQVTRLRKDHRSSFAST